MTKTIIYLLIASTFLWSIICFCSYRLGFYKGYDNGDINGWNRGLDSVQSVLNKQLKSDTTITKLVLVNPDTSVYYFKRKTPLKQSKCNQ